MRITIPGGAGQVGTVLARAFTAAGHDVVVLSRSPRTAPWRVEPWDGAALGGWVRHVDGADVVINLAGRSVNCRYTEENRRRIVDSRVLSTRVVGEAIAAAADPPRVWLQASTATIYAHRFDAPNDDLTGVIGGVEAGAPADWSFSIEVARAWEEALASASTPHTRKVAMRMAMVMNPDPGSIYATLLGLVRYGLGGPVAGGRQFMSWIHERDLVRAVEWLIADDRIEGAVSVAAPEALPQAEFMRVLRHAWGMPIGLPSPRWMLAIGALALGTEPELMLKSRRVVPGRLLQHGFRFDFPAWSDAAADLCARWRAAPSGTRCAA